MLEKEIVINTNIDLSMAFHIMAIYYSNYLKHCFNAKFLIETIIGLCLLIKYRDFQAEEVFYMSSVI